MKKLLFLSLLLSVGCSRCCDYFCNCPDTTHINCEQSPARYAPNQIILDAEGLSSADYDLYKNFLEGKGFKKRDACNCSRRLELWGNDINVDVIGVIADAKGSGSTISGTIRLSLNFDIVPNIVSTPNPDTSQLIKAEVPAGTPVRIVIVDTGVDPTNTNFSFLWRKSVSPPLVPNCTAEMEYGLNVPVPSTEPLDIQGHGTHINGIINGIITNNRPKITGDQSGIPFAQINVKFTADNNPQGSIFKAVCGLYYGLDRGGQVFNLSWGYAGGSAPELIKSFLDVAKPRNVIIVAGAGNNGHDNDQEKFWPASFSDNSDFVISVGAYNAYYRSTAAPALYELYKLTNIGKSVNVFAPGVNVPSIAIGGGSRPAIASGTSMATAYVTRVAAILRGKNPTWTAQQIKECIIKNSGKQTTVDGRVVRIFEAQKVIDACR